MNATPCDSRAVQWCTEYDARVFIYFIKINWACIRRHIQVWLSTIKSMSYLVYAVFFPCIDKFNYYYRRRRQATSSNDVNWICVGINEAIQWIFSFKGDWFEITSILICLQLFYIIFLLQNDLVVGPLPRWLTHFLSICGFFFAHISTTSRRLNPIQIEYHFNSSLEWKR